MTDASPFIVQLATKLKEDRHAIYLGRQDGHPIFGSSEDHLLVIGPPRSGKTSRILTPTVACHPAAPCSNSAWLAHTSSQDWPLCGGILLTAAISGRQHATEQPRWSQQQCPQRTAPTPYGETPLLWPCRAASMPQSCLDIPTQGWLVTFGRPTCITTKIL